MEEDGKLIIIGIHVGTPKEEIKKY